MSIQTALEDRLGLSLVSYWTNLPADPLKKIAGRWLGPDGAKGSKERCLDALAKSLDDPKRLDQVRAGLSPFERAALGLLKLNGGWMPNVQFGPALLALGHPFSRQPGHSSLARYGYGVEAEFQKAQSALEAAGLVGAVNVPRPEASPDLTYYDYRDVVLSAYTDSRLTANLVPEAPLPLPLEPVARTGGGMARRPAEVSLRLLSLIDALWQADSIPITARGRASRSFLNKIGKTLAWEKSLETDPHTPLSDPIQFFYQMLVALRVVIRDEEAAYVATGSEEVAALPYPAQGRLWTLAYGGLTGWLERPLQGMWFGQEDLFYPTPLNGMRGILLTGLAALPDPFGWYDIAGFSQALFDRVGQFYSLASVPIFYEPHRGNEAQKAAARQEWATRLRAAWDMREGAWIRGALAGALYHLGLVEVAWRDEARAGLPDLFRLTDLGRAAITGAYRPELIAPPGLDTGAVPEGPSWIVQPNFDVIAYLDRTAPAELLFLSRVAIRQPSDGAVSIYRLTRESVYKALEEGIPLDGMLAALEAGARQPLAPGVRRALEDWAARRERITVYLNTDLLEYPNEAARDMALEAHPKLGIRVGERFVVVTPETPPDLLRGVAVVDYLEPPVKCLDLHEDGRIDLDPTRADFLIRGELSHWADPDPDQADRWRITAASVRRASQGGWEADQLLAAITKRARGPVPPLLRVAVTAWARKRQSRPMAGLTRALVLQVATQDVADAIAGSAVFKGRFAARLGPRTFLVPAEEAKGVEKVLIDYGLEPIADLAPFAEG